MPSRGSKLPAKVHLALQFAMKTYFRIESVIAVRLAKSVARIGLFKRADGIALIYCVNDVHPGFHFYASADTAPTSWISRGKRIPGSSNF